mmetsp:Transcript_57843/g.183424  ORF Transcript_57843/g.183424 Transcript_57843/m.183424 type:complete len:222 (+) Transcript_57843:376-1041(+)
MHLSCRIHRNRASQVVTPLSPVGKRRQAREPLPHVPPPCLHHRGSRGGRGRSRGVGVGGDLPLQEDVGGAELTDPLGVLGPGHQVPHSPLQLRHHLPGNSEVPRPYPFGVDRLTRGRAQGEHAPRSRAAVLSPPARRPCALGNLAGSKGFLRSGLACKQCACFARPPAAHDRRRQAGGSLRAGRGWQLARHGGVEWWRAPSSKETRPPLWVSSNAFQLPAD